MSDITDINKSISQMEQGEAIHHVRKMRKRRRSTNSTVETSRKKAIEKKNEIEEMSPEKAKFILNKLQGE